jgi:hypothetical protein
MPGAPDSSSAALAKVMVRETIANGGNRGWSFEFCGNEKSEIYCDRQISGEEQENWHSLGWGARIHIPSFSRPKGPNPTSSRRHTPHREFVEMQKPTRKGPQERRM